MTNNTVLIFAVIFLPFAAAVVCYASGRISKPLRNVLAVLFGAADLACAVALAVLGGSGGSAGLPGVCGLGLSFELTGFARVYCLVTAFAWAATLAFSPEYFAHYRNRNRYFFFTLLTLGSAQGVFLAADLVTALVFFEVMSFTSYVWVIHDETDAAKRAANTYLAIAIIGGLAALMGLFLLDVKLGTTRIGELRDAFAKLRASGGDIRPVYAAAGCVLAGFGAKAGLFPLHVWLPKAHPVAPAPASALLSGVLTKTGVFGVAAITCRLMSGDLAWASLVLALGTVTMVLGALMALFSIDLKRTLACSSMSQIGFIVIGVGCCGLLGESGALAAQGSVLHMMNHSVFKLALFMAAGAIYMNLHRLDLNDLRGYGRKKPFLMAVFAVGALGISGVPLFSGYLSKSLLHEGILESAAFLAAGGHSIFAIKSVEWLFLLSGGLTFAYMTKLFTAIFIEKNTDPKLQAEYDSKKFACASPLSFAALGICALIIPVFGVLPDLTAGPLSAVGTDLFGVSAGGSAAWFSLENLKGAAISLSIGAAVYFVVVRPLLMRGHGAARAYVDVVPKKFDLEELVYRPLLLRVLPGIFGSFFALTDSLPNRVFTAKFMHRVGMSTHGSSDLVDLIIVLFRRGIYRESPREEDSKYERTLAYRLGSVIDKRRARAKRRRTSYAESFVSAEKTIGDTTHKITGSLSFALLMLCAGLTAAFIYLMLLR